MSFQSSQVEGVATHILRATTVQPPTQPSTTSGTSPSKRHDLFVAGVARPLARWAGDLLHIVLATECSGGPTSEAPRVTSDSPLQPLQLARAREQDRHPSLGRGRPRDEEEGHRAAGGPSTTGSDGSVRRTRSRDSCSCCNYAKNEPAPDAQRRRRRDRYSWRNYA